MADLSQQQRLFIEGVLSGKTLVGAYRDAGYTANTDASGWSAASRLFRNVKVQAEIKRRMDEQEAIDRLRLDRIRSDAIVQLQGLIRQATNDDRVKLDAVKDTLDRSGMKPKEQIDMKHSGGITIISEYVDETDQEE